MAKNFEKLIKHTVDWVPVVTAPSKNTRRYNDLKSLYGLSGVYQICVADNPADLPSDILDANIGYIGKSKDVSIRMCNVKAPSGSHGARIYFTNKGIDVSKVYYRTLYTDLGSEAELELLLHEAMQTAHGYRFKWKEASAGADGAVVRILADIEKLEEEDLRTIAVAIDTIVAKRYLESWKDEE